MLGASSLAESSGSVIDSRWCIHSDLKAVNAWSRLLASPCGSQRLPELEREVEKASQPTLEDRRNSPPHTIYTCACSVLPILQRALTLRSTLGDVYALRLRRTSECLESIACLASSACLKSKVRWRKHPTNAPGLQKFTAALCLCI